MQFCLNTYHFRTSNPVLTVHYREQVQSKYETDVLCLHTFLMLHETAGLDVHAGGKELHYSALHPGAENEEQISPATASRRPFHLPADTLGLPL